MPIHEPSHLTVIKGVADYYGIKPESVIWTQWGGKTIMVAPRTMAFLLRELCPHLSFQEIGTLLNRPHVRNVMRLVESGKKEDIDLDWWRNYLWPRITDQQIHGSEG